MKAISDSELAKLLTETGAAHHTAYSDSDGVDPEWASWYAPYLETRVGDRLGRKVTRSELIYLLVKASRDHESEGEGLPWNEYYARVVKEG